MEKEEDLASGVEKLSLLDEIEELREFRRRVYQIEQAEINPDEVMVRLKKLQTDKELLQAQLKRAIADESRPWDPAWYIRYNLFIYLSSDLLIAITVFLCGAIGAIFSEIRTERPSFLSGAFRGIIAGFLTFLVVKGGRFLFLVDTGGSSSAFQYPYAVAFAGVLSGLFTEKAYQVLSSVTDRFVEGFKPVSGPDNQGKA